MGTSWFGRRRGALACGCILAALTVVVLIRGVASPRVPDPASLPLPAPMFLAQDGTTYTRVAVAYLDTSKQSEVEVDVPPGRTPLSLYAVCAPARPRSDDRSAIGVRGPTGDDPTFLCEQSHQVQDIDRSALTATGRLRLVQMKTLADAPATAPAAWAVAVYSWTIPATLAPPPAAPQAAATVTVPGTTQRLTLVHQYHGVWPAQRKVGINVPGGRGAVLAFACTSAIADKSITFVPADWQLVDTSSVTCAGTNGSAVNSYTNLYSDQPTTATITLAFDPIVNRRGGSWTVAIYSP
jgi:hypothetical protein